MTFYFGACAGGVWKTTDGGTYWRERLRRLLRRPRRSARSPCRASDPNVIYAGTGETCIRGNVSHGDGVYKSTDGGRPGPTSGCATRATSARSAIHPREPGPRLRRRARPRLGPERGARRLPLAATAAQTWEQVLYKSEQRRRASTSRMDPNNPRILYAAVWEAQRYPHALVSGGAECGLWRRPTAATPGPRSPASPGCRRGCSGKIGVAVSPAQAGPRLGAGRGRGRRAVPLRRRRRDLGAAQRGAASCARRPWYYMHVIADPQRRRHRLRPELQPLEVDRRRQDLRRGPDAARRQPRPLDRPARPAADDRGQRRRRLRLASTAAQTWSTIYNQPTAQFYHVTTDDQLPYRVYGSQQDNTRDQRAEPVDRRRDPRARLVRSRAAARAATSRSSPDDPNIVFAGAIGTRRPATDGMIRYDHRTGQERNITVWPELYGWGVGAESLKYRFQWTFPIFFSPHDPNVLYVAGNRVFRSTDEGTSWEVDQPGPDPQRPGQARALRRADHPRQHRRRGLLHDLRPRRVAARARACFWAGTDDGLVHLSRDGGKTWQNVTPPDLPEWALISIIEPSPHDAGDVLRRRHALQARRHAALPLQDRATTARPGRAITDGIPDDEFTRVDPRGPEPARAALRRHRDGHLRLVRRRRRTGSGCAATCRSCRSTT